MAFRAVVVESECFLHVRQGWLEVARDDGQMVAVPLEDVAVLVLENPRTAVSTAGLALLCEQGVAVAACDRHHLPRAVALPFCAHSRQTGILRLQLSASLPLKKRLWQRLVTAKITNQAACLDALGLDGGALLRGYARQVLSGDTSGMEAAAARVYFQRILPGESRHGGSARDRALDYGYAVLRAAVARALVAHGLHPPLGVHHDSQLNAFNLADDVLEVFRPWVDYAVAAWNLSAAVREHRQRLVGLLHARAGIGSDRVTVLTAADTCATSLVTALEAKDAGCLLTPVFVPPDPGHKGSTRAAHAPVRAVRPAGEDEA